MACIQYCLLYLAFLPAGSGIAELVFIQVMANHGVEALVDLALLTPTNLVHGGLHVVVDAALRYTAEGHEGVVVRIEQHLV